MVLKLLRTPIVIAALLAASGMIGSVATAQAGGPGGELFYNYYAPVSPAGVSANMYPSPIPTPPHVGHTYITYQPLMPHEYLYQHHRVYWRNNPGAGMTRTSVSWGHSWFPNLRPPYGGHFDSDYFIGPLR